MTPEESRQWDIAHPGFTAEQLGIPKRETHARDIVRYDACPDCEAKGHHAQDCPAGLHSLLVPRVLLNRTPPHRSRWRHMNHRGDGCLWMRVRFRKRKVETSAEPSPPR